MSGKAWALLAALIFAALLLLRRDKASGHFESKLLNGAAKFNIVKIVSESKLPAIHEFWPSVKEEHRKPSQLNMSAEITTAKGDISLQNLLLKVFRPLGYRFNFDENSTFTEHGFVSLYSPDLPCDRVFSEWLQANRLSPNATSNVPPHWGNLTEETRDRMTLSGHSALRVGHASDDAHNGDQAAKRVFTQSRVDALQRVLERPLVSSYGTYGSHSASLVYAMRAHLKAGAKGMSIGSISPWVEALALHLKASSVTVAEYQPIDSHVPHIHWAHPLQIAANWSAHSEVDFVASFSSMEHSGLGRYGDAIDPIGDLREARKVHCLLKPGGLFFLGLPVGTLDGVSFNFHRIYGPIRWSLISAGFRVLGFYGAGSEGSESLPALLRRLGSPFPRYFQPTAVLQKL